MSSERLNEPHACPPPPPQGSHSQPHKIPVEFWATATASSTQRPRPSNARPCTVWSQPAWDPAGWREAGGGAAPSLSLPGYFSLITHFTLWSDPFYNWLTRILGCALFYLSSSAPQVKYWHFYTEYGASWNEAVQSDTVWKYRTETTGRVKALWAFSVLSLSVPSQASDCRLLRFFLWRWSLRVLHITFPLTFILVVRGSLTSYCCKVLVSPQLKLVTLAGYGLYTNFNIKICVHFYSEVLFPAIESLVTS